MIKAVETQTQKGKCMMCCYKDIKKQNKTCDDKKCFPHERKDGKNVYFERIGRLKDDSQGSKQKSG